jgi:patatin-like phospholipase/acyl hydrolase
MDRQASAQQDGDDSAAPGGQHPTSYPTFLDETPRDIHVDMYEMIATADQSIATVDEDSPWAKKTILSFDSGGVRGLSSLLILKRIMDRVKELEETGDPKAYSSIDSPLINPLNRAVDPQAPKKAAPTSVYLPCHYFDYIAGTSTGGLIAIMLGRLRTSVDACVDMYVQLSEKVFEKPSLRLKQLSYNYSSKYRRDALVSMMGKMTPLVQPSLDEQDNKFESDSIRCRTVVCALSKSPNEGSRTPFLFRSYHHPAKTINPFERNPDKGQAFNITDVACASSGAPFYFKSYQVGSDRFFDGGVAINNPSWEVWNEVNLMHKRSHNPIDILLSLGSGTAKKPKPISKTGGRRWKALSRT